MKETEERSSNRPTPKVKTVNALELIWELIGIGVLMAIFMILIIIYASYLMQPKEKTNTNWIPKAQNERTEYKTTSIKNEVTEVNEVTSYSTSRPTLQVKVWEDYKREEELEKERIRKQRRQMRQKKLRLRRKQKAARRRGFPQYQGEEYLIAQIIQCEAGNTYEDRCYVGSVLINRARTNYHEFEDLHTIADVLYQGYYSGVAKQYATRTISLVEQGIEPSEEALEVAKGLIDGSIPCLDESILFQTTYTPNFSVSVVWLEGAVNVYSRPLDY